MCVISLLTERRYAGRDYTTRLWVCVWRHGVYRRAAMSTATPHLLRLCVIRGGTGGPCGMASVGRTPAVRRPRGSTMLGLLMGQAGWWPGCTVLAGCLAVTLASTHHSRSVFDAYQLVVTSKPRLLVVLSAGGHASQLLALIEAAIEYAAAPASKSLSRIPAHSHAL